MPYSGKRRGTRWHRPPSSTQSCGGRCTVPCASSDFRRCLVEPGITDVGCGRLTSLKHDFLILRPKVCFRRGQGVGVKHETGHRRPIVCFRQDGGHHRSILVSARRFFGRSDTTEPFWCPRGDFWTVGPGWDGKLTPTRRLSAAEVGHRPGASGRSGARRRRASGRLRARSGAEKHPPASICSSAW